MCLLPQCLSLSLHNSHDHKQIDIGLIQHADQTLINTTLTHVMLQHRHYSRHVSTTPTATNASFKQ